MNYTKISSSVRRHVRNFELFDWLSLEIQLADWSTDRQAWRFCTAPRVKVVCLSPFPTLSDIHTI